MKPIDKCAARMPFLMIGSTSIPVLRFDPDENSGDILRGNVFGRFRSDASLVDDAGFDVGASLASGECVARLCLSFDSWSVMFDGDVKVTDYRVTSVVGEVANYQCRVESVHESQVADGTIVTSGHWDFTPPNN